MQKSLLWFIWVLDHNGVVIGRAKATSEKKSKSQIFILFQIIFMFGWTFMQFMNVTCMVIPFLNLYLTGVAMTCITTFIFGLIRIVLSDNTDCESSFGINLRTQKQLEHEKSADEIFSYLNLCCIIVHLFWFLFGSINFLPLFFTEGLYIRRDLTGGECEAPVQFWLSFLCLCLQWFLVVVVTLWFMVETTFCCEEEISSSSCGEDIRGSTVEFTQEICQYQSFPRPSF